ncbi:MAG: rhodanese, partial [Clostridiales bacterium]|nr:rhodanese [Clostridiales bacterium]
TAAILFIFVSGCSTKSGDQIIEANKISKYSNQSNVVIVDMQKPEDYAKGHIKGAVNIPRDEIVINTPVENMLAPKDQIEKVMGKNGISNNTTVLAYDNANNMDAARLWWTMKVYGHENIKVVSGGFNALKAVEESMITQEAAKVNPATYTAKEADKNMIASIEEVKKQVGNPQGNVVLRDTRTKEEFGQGTIPGSVLMDFMDNNYKTGSFKSPEAIQYQYVENKITKDKTVIMYCKTSVRAAETYLVLYNAGYRNLKLYDGAWLEWSADKSLPIQNGSGAKAAEQGSKPSNNAEPAKPVEPSNKDNS